MFWVAACQKLDNDSTKITSSGKLFQISGPTTGTQQSTNISLKWWRLHERDVPDLSEHLQQL